MNKSANEHSLPMGDNNVIQLTTNVLHLIAIPLICCLDAFMILDLAVKFHTANGLARVISLSLQTG